MTPTHDVLVEAGLKRARPMQRSALEQALFERQVALEVCRELKRWWGRSTNLIDGVYDLEAIVLKAEAVLKESKPLSQSEGG